jgi:dolichyl-phosphate beta-glucosyltransferase
MKVIQPGSPVGKGRDVLVGMKAATGKKIIFMDADLATPLHHIKELTEKLDIADLVIGSRKFSATHSGFRRVASSILNKFTRLLIGLHGIRDTQCGFKGFTASSADLIFNRQTILGWGFDIEILLIAKIHKLKILQIPIPDWKDPKGDLGLAGESTLSASFRTLREVLKIKINKVRGCYK